MNSNHIALPVQGSSARGDHQQQAEGPTIAYVVLDALDDADVRWCLLRGGPDALACAEDVDVLVAPDDLPRAVEVIKSHRFIQLPSYGRGSHQFFLGFDQTSASWVKFDLVTEMAYGPRFEVRTDAAPQCLERRRRRRGVWILCPEDEFWALLLHCVLDKGAMPVHHLRRLMDLRGSISISSPLRRTAQATIDLGRHPAEGWASLVAQRGEALAKWRRAHPIDAFRRVITSAAMGLMERPLQAWSRRGASVALLGPDGAGKSTLADGIESAFYFPVRKVYMGLWASSETSHGIATRVLRILFRPIAVWLRYLNSVRHRACGRLVVFDRYVYDALLPPQGSLRWLKRPYLSMLSRLCPAPDMVILLDAPGPVMHQRSGEYDPEHLESERAYYQRLSRRIPRLLEVDANRPPDAVLADALERIWGHYVDKAGR
jgi:thymidylate kinase